MHEFDKSKKDRIEITEMFMAQTSDNECFYGIIKRSKDANGNPHLFSRITVNDGNVQACASDQKELGRMLDEMCKMVLYSGLHNNYGHKIKIFDAEFYLN